MTELNQADTPQGGLGGCPVNDKIKRPALLPVIRREDGTSA